jgi:hypothetical protein
VWYGAGLYHVGEVQGYNHRFRFTITAIFTYQFSSSSVQSSSLNRAYDNLVSVGSSSASVVNSNTGNRMGKVEEEVKLTEGKQRIDTIMEALRPSHSRKVASKVQGGGDNSTSGTGSRDNALAMIGGGGTITTVGLGSDDSSLDAGVLRAGTFDAGSDLDMNNGSTLGADLGICSGNSSFPVTAHRFQSCRELHAIETRGCRISIRLGHHHRSWGRIEILALVLEEITTNGGVALGTVVATAVRAA